MRETQIDRIVHAINKITAFVSGSGVSKSVFSQTNTVTVANSNTETTILGTGTGSLTLPANYLVAGRTIKITLLGVISTDLTPTINVTASLGSTDVLTTGTVTTNTVSDSLVECVCYMTCKTAGATGTVYSQGYFRQDQGGITSYPMANTTTATIDTTSSQTINITITWGTASAFNTITSTNCIIEALN
jgi:hypothetical protein